MSSKIKTKIFIYRHGDMFIIYCYFISYRLVQPHFNKMWKDGQKQNKQSEGSVVCFLPHFT